MAVDEQQKRDLIEQIADNPQSSFLIRLSEGDSLLTGVSVLQKLVNEKGQNGVYFTCNTNTPFVFLDRYLAAHKIDTSKLLVLDTVSVPVLGKKGVPKDNAYFTTREVMTDSVKVLNGMIDDWQNLGFVYFDSITELLKFHSETEIVGFLVQLVNLLKRRKMTGLILSFYGEREVKLAEAVMRYCDRYYEF